MCLILQEKWLSVSQDVLLESEWYLNFDYAVSLLQSSYDNKNEDEK